MIKLWKRLDLLLDEIAKRRHLLLVIDFDGTLSEIVPTLGQSNLSPARLDILNKLSTGPMRVAILSGRAAGDLKRRIKMDKIIYCGNYGMEMQGPGIKYLQPRMAAFREMLKVFEDKHASLFRQIPGVLVEGKGLGVALHYRNVAKEHLPSFRTRWARFRRGGGLSGFNWFKGNCAWEVIPDVPWDKGKATEHLWRALGKPFALAIGNDQTDEPMFKAVKGKGMAIRVGYKTHSHASYWLNGESDVYRFLEVLVKLLEKQPRKHRNHH